MAGERGNCVDDGGTRSRGVKQILEAAGTQFVPKLLAGVFNFSVGQPVAHVEKFADALIKFMGAWKLLSNESKTSERENFKHEAQDYKKGCQTYLYTSRNQVKQEGNLVPVTKRDTFECIISDMLSIDTTHEEFTEVVNEFLATFPLLKNWITWWTKPTIASMIFPAC
ncbi:hypothetical protein PHLCEN_2v6379 [Hermanssonia centrifuga]|uniref:Uncharacterized protein n=1 Tax=Hermanssonia centrifuga TaxID=98765 RepID=A0A2R6NZN6_9APHY|nr:hypothetical protein PHLCEN_2v6379 [Hermanssonia centrifuga]